MERLTERRLTKRVMKRFRNSMIVFSIVMLGSVFTNVVLSSFSFDGETYDHYKLKEFDRGFIEIYSNRDEVCTSWVLVPGTELIAYWLLAIAYFMALIYLFLGVAIVSDIFMGAIEVITSQTRRIKYEDEDGVEKFLEVSVWNPTIANLTLMALGSSAPEILLNIIETISTLDSEPGELGPSTIVGSAAFNLLVISAVSIIAVPTGTIKKVDDMGVFFTTCFFSLLAYVWLYIVLAVWTEDRVTIAEAIITLSFFFLLVILAYIADRVNEWRMKKKQAEDPNADLNKPEDIGRLFNIEDFYHILTLAKAEEKHKPNNDDTMKPDENDEELKEESKTDKKLEETKDRPKKKEDHDRRIQLQEYLKETFKVDDVRDIDPEDVKQAIAPRSVIGRMKYRRIIGNQLSGRKPFVVVKGMKRQMENELASGLRKEDLNPYVGFKCLHYSVTEGAGHLQITIYKKTLDALEIGVRTLDDTAYAPDDYHALDETLVFTKEETEKTIKVEIVDDNEWEPDEDFLVELYDVNTSNRLKGKDTQTRITIIDDDKPGTFGFLTTNQTCQAKHKQHKIKVTRKDGWDGIVKLKYEIKEADEGKFKHKAKKFEDFVPAKDTLIFEHGEIEKEITVDLIEQEHEDPERDDVLQVRLFEVEPQGAEIRGKNNCILHIVGDNELDHKVEDIEKILDIMQKSNEVSWIGQFKKACLLHPQVDEEGNVDEVTGLEAFLHFTSIGWKVFFAIIPPARMCKGWFSFCVSLVFIGLITAIIAEFAELFGCVIGLKPAVTAITFVALGTSLPDTFASKQAAQESKNADSAIGNVTGSNSVNVFLGLGLPWVIAVIYYESSGDNYNVPAGTLSFSVMLFLITSVVCIIFLEVKRFFTGGELGGPNGWWRWGSFAFLVSLWWIYILFSSLKAYDHV